MVADLRAVHGQTLIKDTRSHKDLEHWEGVHRVRPRWRVYCDPCKLRAGLTGHVIVWCGSFKEPRIGLPSSGEPSPGVALTCLFISLWS